MAIMGLNPHSGMSLQLSCSVQGPCNRNFHECMSLDRYGDRVGQSCLDMPWTGIHKNQFFLGEGQWYNDKNAGRY